MIVNSSIYRGAVIHERKRPQHHRLNYKVFSLLLDLDELTKISSASKMLSYNRWGLFSVFDKDHGDGNSIRDWVNSQLRKKSLADCSDKILMLCYPRIFGYVFNPLTVFFCYRKNGTLGAILYEVHNTFKERHCYLLPVNHNEKPIIKQVCEKDFYVSPFVPENCTYKFRIQAPGEKVCVVIREEDSQGLLLAATFSGRRTSLNDSALVKMALCYPLMTLKVMVGIHIEAFKLFLKRVPFIAHKPKSESASNGARSFKSLNQQ
jgi:uncharacterized protein